MVCQPLVWPGREANERKWAPTRRVVRSEWAEVARGAWEKQSRSLRSSEPEWISHLCWFPKASGSLPCPLKSKYEMRGGRRNQFRAIIRKANGGSGLSYSSLIKMIYNRTHGLFCSACSLGNSSQQPLCHTQPVGNYLMGFIEEHHQTVRVTFPAPCLLAAWGISGQELKDPGRVGFWGFGPLAAITGSAKRWSPSRHFPLSLPSPDRGEGRLPRAAG